jgi:hypothetical protein
MRDGAMATAYQVAVRPEMAERITPDHKQRLGQRNFVAFLLANQH